MSRLQETLVVYGHDLMLPTASVEKWEVFDQWVAEGLARLEARWIDRAAPRDRRPVRPSLNLRRHSR